MSNVEEIKKALEEVGPLKVEFTPDCDDFNSIIAPINADYDGTYFTLIGAGDKQNDLGNLFTLAVNSMPELITTLEALQRENEALRSLSDQMKLEAQSHAMEARGANATINEIYQIISGGKGQPGNWNGAEPVRQYVQAVKGEILRLETEVVLSKPVYSRRQIEARVKSLEGALTGLVEDLEARSVNGTVNCSHGVYCTAREALASAGEEHHAE